MTKKLISLEPDFSDEDGNDSDGKDPNQDERALQSGDDSSSRSVKIKESEPQGPEWECVMSIKREMSWGLATVHLQRKIR